jgi:hypothetical protein
MEEGEMEDEMRNNFLMVLGNKAMDGASTCTKCAEK